MSVELLGQESHFLYEVYGETPHQRGRMLYPSGGEVNGAVLDAFRLLKRRSGIVGLVDGAFDVLHCSHEWYLRHCKALGAAACLDTVDAGVIRSALTRKEVALAVTVDADHKIAMKKSGKAEKGGVERPIYPWVARAERVAGYVYEIKGGVYYTADLVTAEGDPLHEGTLLESSLSLAKGLQDEGLLDYFVIYGEHGDTLQEARNMGLRPLVISDGMSYHVNPQTGEPWSSSAIIARAQGVAVPSPITRPEAGEYE